MNNFNYRHATGQTRKLVVAINNAAKTWTPERVASVQARTTGRRAQLTARREEASRDRYALLGAAPSGLGSYARRVRKLRRRVDRDLKRIEKAMKAL